MRKIFSVLLLFCGIASALPAGAATSTASATSTPTTVAAGADDSARSEGSYERAVVETMTTRANATPGGAEQVEIYRLHFLSGPYKGETREISGDIGGNPYRLRPDIGDKVVVLVQTSPEGNVELYLDGFDRRAAMLWLILLFVATLVVLSGWQGFKTAASIVVSVLAIGYVLIPLFLRGVNPIPVAILLGGVLTLLASGLSTGWNRKAVITAIGTMGGALVAYAISLIFANWSHLDGLSTEEDRLFFDRNPGLNPRGLLFAGIIIASVGVVEDVAVSIASGVSEIRRHHPRASFRELFLSGMTVGRDHMSALANTLVFAYVGASLSTLLLYTQFGGSWLKFINFDSIVDEVIRSLAGTIGLVFTVPITALLAAWVAGERGTNGGEHGGHDS